MIRRLLFFALVLFSLAGCGYHLAGQGAGALAGIETLHVKTFANKTARPFLDARMTEAMVERMARKRGLAIVEKDAGADAQMIGTVTAYRKQAVAYDVNDDISEYKATMTVEAALVRNRDGKTLWKGSVEWSEEFLAALDRSVQYSNENEAILTLSERLAEELFYRISDDF